MNQEKIKEAIKIILEEIGEDVEREGIKYTPTRVARLYGKLFYGYTHKLKVVDEAERNTIIEENVIPITTFKTDKQELLIREVHFNSMCEHHLASITNGRCWVGIIPSEMLLGMNKIDQIVKYFAARLQIQERLTSEIADWINDNIKPKGVIVVMKANHMCAELQGDSGEFTTAAVRGVFATELNARQEFYKLKENN
jgi:GTP cyclohydrolase I